MQDRKVNYRAVKFYCLFAVVFAGIFLLAACGETKKADAESGTGTNVLDEESLYQLDSKWLTQDNDTFRLGQLSGKVPIISMVFTSCPFACPRIVDHMKEIEELLPPEIADEVVFVLVSFDTERDHPERLKAFAGEMGLGEKNWVLLHGNEAAVRELSMVLGVNYKKQAGGDFAHSNVVTLLDTRGRIVESVEGLGKNPAPILNKIKEL